MRAPPSRPAGGIVADDRAPQGYVPQMSDNRQKRASERASEDLPFPLMRRWTGRNNKGHFCVDRSSSRALFIARTLCTARGHGLDGARVLRRLPSTSRRRTSVLRTLLARRCSRIRALRAAPHVPRAATRKATGMPGSALPARLSPWWRARRGGPSATYPQSEASPSSTASKGTARTTSTPR